MAGADHLQGFLATIDTRNFDFMVEAAWSTLIGQKVVLQAIEECQRNLTDIGIASVGRIIFHDGDDLVIRFATVRHTKPTDGQGREENIAMRNRLLREDADIEGIAVSAMHARPVGPCGK